MSNLLSLCQTSTPPTSKTHKLLALKQRLLSSSLFPTRFVLYFGLTVICEECLCELCICPIISSLHESDRDGNHDTNKPRILSAVLVRELHKHLLQTSSFVFDCSLSLCLEFKLKKGIFCENTD